MSKSQQILHYKYEYDKSALTLKVNHNNGNISHPVSKMNTINNNNKDVISPTISNEYNLSEINNINMTKHNINNDKVSESPLDNMQSKVIIKNKSINIIKNQANNNNIKPSVSKTKIMINNNNNNMMISGNKQKKSLLCIDVNSNKDKDNINNIKLKSTKINKCNNNNNNDKISIIGSLDDNQIIESSLDYKQISGSSHDDKQYKNNNNFKKTKNIKKNKNKKKNYKKINNKKKFNKKLNENKTSKDISIINDVIFNDMITKINEFKEKGNNYFMNNNFIKASLYYHKARDLIDKYIPDMDENDNLYMNKIENLNELIMKINNNFSAIYLKEKKYEECINYATKVLVYDGENIKALSRRREAAAHLGINTENLNKMIEHLRK